MRQVCLVACVKKKRAHRSRAEHLYNSPLFRAASNYARQFDGWWILSAKYGLLSPSDWVEPYDESLFGMTSTERRHWSMGVMYELDGQHMDGDRVTILAGRKYREFIAPALVDAGFCVEVPMVGLGIGQQMSWLKGRVLDR